jgi:hypothetical protein
MHRLRRRPRERGRGNNGSLKESRRACRFGQARHLVDGVQAMSLCYALTMRCHVYPVPYVPACLTVRLIPPLTSDRGHLHR